jgi:hypothetical protein
MNAKAIVAGVVILVTGLVSGEDGYRMTLNPQALPPGSIVRIAAVKPPINLGRATVMECTSNQLTLRHRNDRFKVAATNILDMVVIERGTYTASTDEHAESASDEPKESAAPAPPPKKNLWERIKSLWQPDPPAKAPAPVNPTR